MSATTEHPKVFISYSWTDSEHEEFVMGLATALRNNGVDAILDKWDLKPGQDKYAFMESMVVDPSVVKVLVMCDRKYQDKANARAGGVGTESQIISQELYTKVKQTKFIPVVCEYDDGQPCLPVFMKGLIFIDVSTDERYGEGLDHLLRLIYEQPFHQKPKLGGPPEFVTNQGASYVKELGAAVRAIKDGKPNRQGLETQFVRSLVTELDALYVRPQGNDYDEGVYQAIAATKVLRDQVAEYAETVADFSGDDPASQTPVIKLMEMIGARFGSLAGDGVPYYPGWADFYRFFALETLLIQTAALIRNSRWKCIRRLLSAAYAVRGESGEQRIADYVEFNANLRSLDEHRNRRLALNRISLTADTIKERCSSDRATFAELSEADVLLMLASVTRIGAPEVGRRAPYVWHSKTTVFWSFHTQSPLFMKAIDPEVRSGIRESIGVATGAELAKRLLAAEKELNGFQCLSRGIYSDFNFRSAINADELTK